MFTFSLGRTSSFVLSSENQTFKVDNSGIDALANELICSILRRSPTLEIKNLLKRSYPNPKIAKSLIEARLMN